MLPQLRDLDRPLIGAVLALGILGITAVYSANFASEVPVLRTVWQKQLGYGLLAIPLAIAVIRAPTRFLYAAAYPIFFGCLVALLAVLVFGTGEDAHRWLAIGPIQLQPSEFAKVGAILAQARYLADTAPAQCSHPRVFVASFLIVGLPMLLVAPEPDLGTALAYVAPLVPMLFWAGTGPAALFCVVSPLLSVVFSFEPAWQELTPYLFALYILVSAAAFFYLLNRLWLILTMVGLNLGSGLLAVYVWEHLLRPYQRDRIVIFLDPESDRLGAGWNIIQSMIAIGSGGLTGKGFLHGTQTKYEFLPAAHTDFVFAVIGEELGFVGTMVVLALFLFVILRAVSIASATKNRFLSLTAIGVASMLLFHVFVNVGMTIGLMPVTGLPLPFVSSGGSSLLANSLVIALLLHAHLNRHDF